MASKHPIRSRDIVSGKIKAQDCTVAVEAGGHRQADNQKPWVDFRSIWIYVKKRRQRIGVLFRRKSRRRPLLLEGVDCTTPHPSRSSVVHSRPNGIRNFGSTSIDTSLIPAATLASNQNDNSQLEKENAEVDVTVPLTALMIRRREQKKKGAAVEKLPERKTVKSNSGDEPLFSDANVGSRHANMQSGMSQHRSRSETEHFASGYIPPKPPRGCKEFTSSAVMIKPPSGNPEAMKLFYDSMSTDNWASEDFVKTFGLQKRPILPDDLCTYETVKGDYTPRYYIEILLQDKSRGMKDFATMSCNVTPAMDGIGLVAGSEFMREHRIKSRDVTDHRDIYVTTGRKADAGKLQSKYKMI